MRKKEEDKELDEWSEFSLENAVRGLEGVEIVDKEKLKEAVRKFDDSFVRGIIEDDLLKEGEEEKIMQRWITNTTTITKENVMGAVSDIQSYIEKRCQEDERFKIEYEAIRRFMAFLKSKYKGEELLRVLRMLPIDRYEYNFTDEVLYLGTIKVKGRRIKVFWDDSDGKPMFCAEAEDGKCIHTQGETVEELIENVKEAVELCREDI